MNQFFTWIMMACYHLVNNYGWAILIFTLLTKVLLLPLSIWIQKNSIKMVKMQPQINKIKIKYFGDSEMIAEHEAELYKQENYHPLAGLIPTVVQLVLLMGVIEAIRNGIADPAINMVFYGMNLSVIPWDVLGWYLLCPFMAALSSYWMCEAQNRVNVIQAEQSKGYQYGVTAFSVLLSLYLGFFVPSGVALYWIASNIMSVGLTYLLNIIINPKKYVDYSELEKTKAELAELGSIGSDKKVSKQDKKREKADYKRFFKVVNKHLVFYSEESGFYKYYRGMIQYILDHTNLTIHYITSDPRDQIFELAEKEPQIKPYYIGDRKLITLMMKMDADVVVMTMPDLETYQIKRSLVRHDIEYVNIPHGISSNNLMYRKGALDHYDTIFTTGPHQDEEIRETERIYHLPEKRIVKYGYALLDDMRSEYNSKEHKENKVHQILIAPSWAEDNIMDSCLDTLVQQLHGHGWKVIIRPHPQYVRHHAAKLEKLKRELEQFSDVELQTDFSSNSTVFDSDLVITDWSGITLEFSFTTLKPSLSINTKMKVMNPEWEKIPVPPMDIWIRDAIGISMNPEDLSNLSEEVEKLLANSDEWRDKIGKLIDQSVYNPYTSAQVAGEYLISAVEKKIKERKENES